MSQIEIRRALSADIPALRGLQERSMRVLGRRHYTPAQIETFIARIGTMDDYLVGDGTYLLAELDGVMLGCGGWTRRRPGYAQHAAHEVHSPDPRCATVRSLFVEPLAARRGVGRRLMGAIEEALRGEGFRVAELGSTDMACAFYRGLGYRPAGRFLVELGDGMALRLTRMRKDLAAANADEPVPVLLIA